MILLRSVVFNAAFYLAVALYSIPSLIALLLPRRVMLLMIQSWARTSLWLLRVICGTKVEWRGLDRLPQGAALIAAKHQSAWDTFAMLPLVRDPAYVLKRELMWIPGYGWASKKAGMIPVDRGAGRAALVAMAQRVRDALARGYQVFIFPEGTRRAPGAPPDYKYGVAMLYAEAGSPCIPVALNSGLYWPRRKWVRLPGTVIVEILEPIPPGLDRKAFFATLQDRIETATARLVDEGRRDLARQGLVAMVDEAPLASSG